MAYAFVQDISASWELYTRVAARVLEPIPEGLIVQLAGPTDEGFRIIALWESEQAWRRFQAVTLQPAIAALGGPAHPEPVFRDLHPAHLVRGTPHANADAAAMLANTTRDKDPSPTTGGTP